MIAERRPATGEHLYVRNDELVRYQGLYPPASKPALAGFGVTFKRLEWMSRSLSLDEPWSGPKAERRDALSVEAWIERHVHPSSAKTLFRDWIRFELAAEPSQLSLLHLLFHMSSGYFFDSEVSEAAYGDPLP